MYRQANKLFSPLLEMLTDYRDSQYDKVARMALQVVSVLSTSEDPELPAPYPSPPATRGGLKTRESTHSAAAKQAAVGKTHNRLNEYFRKFMVELLNIFDSDRPLLEEKGSFLIRYVTVPHRVICAGYQCFTGGVYPCFIRYICHTHRVCMPHPQGMMAQYVHGSPFIGHSQLLFSVDVLLIILLFISCMWNVYWCFGYA